MKGKIISIAFVSLLIVGIYLIPQQSNLALAPTTSCIVSNIKSKDVYKCAHCFVKPTNFSLASPLTLQTQTNEGTIHYIDSCYNYTCEEMMQTLDSTSEPLLNQNISEVSEFLNIISTEHESISGRQTLLNNSKSWVAFTQTTEQLPVKVTYSDETTDERLMMIEILFYATSVLVIIIVGMFMSTHQSQSVIFPILIETLVLAYLLAKTNVFSIPNALNELTVVVVLSYFIVSLELSTLAKVTVISLMGSASLFYDLNMIGLEAKSYFTLALIIIAIIPSVKIFLRGNGSLGLFLNVLFSVLLSNVYLVYSFTEHPICLTIGLWIMNTSIPFLFLQNECNNKARLYESNINVGENIQAEELEQYEH